MRKQAILTACFMTWLQTVCGPAMADDTGWLARPRSEAQWSMDSRK